ncbi:hypothetical protein J3B02_002718 [Coemansia erecta]|nr:hypothetical protein J3B02_002718 [Coemansia erecta]
MPSHSLDLQITEACSGSSLADTEDSSDDDAEANEVASDNAGMHKSYSALVMPSVWGSAASNVGPTSKQEAVIAALSRTA